MSSSYQSLFAESLNHLNIIDDDDEALALCLLVIILLALLRLTRLESVGRGRFAERWELSTIPRNDVAIIGEPRLGTRSLDAAGGLGLVLRYLGSAMLEISLQQIFALTLSTVSRYLDFAKKILLQLRSSSCSSSPPNF
jgi:hypothetical protein